MWVPQGELLRAPAASSIDSIAAGFPRQKLWGLMFLALESWDMGPGVGLGLFAPRISLLNFYQRGCSGSPFCVRAPLTILDGCGFFNSVVVRLSRNPISDVPE